VKRAESELIRRYYYYYFVILLLFCWRRVPFFSKLPVRKEKWSRQRTAVRASGSASYFVELNLWEYFWLSESCISDRTRWGKRKHDVNYESANRGIANSYCWIIPFTPCRCRDVMNNCLVENFSPCKDRTYVIAGSPANWSLASREATQRLLSDEPTISRYSCAVPRKNRHNRFIWSVKSKVGASNPISVSWCVLKNEKIKLWEIRPCV